MSQNGRWQKIRPNSSKEAYNASQTLERGKGSEKKETEQLSNRKGRGKRGEEGGTEEFAPTV